MSQAPDEEDQPVLILPSSGGDGAAKKQKRIEANHLDLFVLQAQIDML